MKSLTKLSLAIATAAVCHSAYALEAMSDSDLSNATGQDGITVKIITPTAITIDSVILHDKDGLVGSGGTAGAIVLGAPGVGKQFSIDTDGISLIIDADGGAGGAAPVLNVGIELGATTINTGSIGVAASKRTNAAWVGTSGHTAAANRGITGAATEILSSIGLTIDGLSMNLQLGAATQSAWLELTGTVTGGIQLDSFQINDTNGTVDAASDIATAGGSLGFGQLTITGNGQTNLALDATVDINHKGLLLGFNTSAFDILIEDLRVGSNATANTLDFTTAPTGAQKSQTIGDLELVNVNLSGSKILISGH